MVAAEEQAQTLSSLSSLQLSDQCYFHLSFLLPEPGTCFCPCDSDISRVVLLSLLFTHPFSALYTTLSFP